MENGLYFDERRILDGRVMDNDSLTALHRIREEIRLIGAIGEVFQLFESMAGPVKLEPDCLGVVGRTDRVPNGLCIGGRGGNPCFFGR